MLATHQLDLVARWTAIGIVLGLAGGALLSAPDGGDVVQWPILLPLLGMLVGGLLGGGAGLAVSRLLSRSPPHH